MPDDIRETCGVVAVSAAGVREVGLTVEPDPAPTPGHVLIGELTWQQFEDDRQRVLEWAGQLAKRAQVLIPPGKPPKAANPPGG